MGRVLEQVSGEGDVYEGENQLGQVSYDIAVYQKTMTANTLAAARRSTDCNESPRRSTPSRRSASVSYLERTS